MKITITIFIFLIVSIVTLTVAAQQASEAEHLEKWFESDNDDEQKALQVNEGDLVFLSDMPDDKPTHSITNNFTISDDSLKTSWVNLHQCHKNLDPVAASEIVYKYKNMRNLEIERYSGMEKAWVDKQSVQMEDIQKGASLCIKAEVQILRPTNSGEYILRNGPYFRKFLDGYYPFHVKLNINYPKSALKLKSTMPKAQKGFKVTDQDGVLVLDAQFEGELVVEVYFSSAD